MDVKTLLHEQKKSLHGLVLRDGVDWIIDRYINQRIDGAEISEDGDMLLFQWGSYKWFPPGTISLDLTRQITLSDAGIDEDIMLQLRCVYHYKMKGVKPSGHFWCRSPLNCDVFTKNIIKNDLYIIYSSIEPHSITLDINDCG